MTSTAPSRNNHHHKPLHNFSLPFLNWGQKPSTTSTRRNRFPTSTPTPDADVITRRTRHHHPRRTFTPDDDVTTHKRAHHKHRDDDVIFRTDSHRRNNRHKASKSTSYDEDDVIVRKDKSTNDDDDDVTEKLVDVDVAAAVEVELKPWKLRPRKSVNGKGNGNGNGEVNGNGDGEGGGGGVRGSGRLLRTVEVVAAEAVAEEEDREKMMKRRLWISLSKDEIEHDILLFTGAKPVRRPKKRNKIAQKHLDNVFPGLYLVGMSADSYRV